MKICLMLLLAASGLAQGAEFNCPATPPAIQDIQAIGYYTDPAHSIRDEALFAQNRALTAPIEHYAHTVVKLADRYLEQADPAVASCALAWLDRWAREGALLGQAVHINNDQAEYVRKWTHASLALAYLRLRPAASAETRARIDAWLKAIAQRTLAFWESPKHERNNHYYWMGVGVMATALATGDPTLQARARSVYEQGVDAIRDDGSLPLEMKRASRAFHYHNFAMEPLVTIATLAASTGADWFGYHGGRIHLLANRVAEGWRNPSSFAQPAGGVTQLVPAKNDKAWMELYRSHAPQPDLFAALLDAPPYFDVRLGGNLTLAAARGVYAAPLP